MEIIWEPVGNLELKSTVPEVKHVLERLNCKFEMAEEEQLDRLRERPDLGRRADEKWKRPQRQVGHLAHQQMYHRGSQKRIQ